MGATSGGFFFWVFLFLACFQMGFYFVTTGWIFEIGLCVSIQFNSIHFNSPQYSHELCAISLALLIL